MNKRNLTGIAILAMLACAGCGSGTSAGDEPANTKVDQISAEMDASTLGRDIKIWYVDNTDAPAISLEDNIYFVGDPDDAYPMNSPWEASLKGAHFESEFISSGDWCVVIFNADESIAASYSAANGLEEGNSCD